MNRILEEAGQRATWRPDTHCLALDGVRGLAILAVTVYRICKEFDPSEHPALAIVRRFADRRTRRGSILCTIGISDHRNLITHKE